MTPMAWDVDFITDESAGSGSRQDFRFSRIPETLGEFRDAVIKSTSLAMTDVLSRGGAAVID